MDALLGKPGRARRLEEWLSGNPRIREVRASAVSGRVLVVFDPAPPKLRIGLLLQDALRRIDEEAEIPTGKTARYQDLLHLVRTSLPEDKYVRGAVFFSVLSFSIHFCEGMFVVSTIKSRSKISGEAPGGKPMPLLAVTAVSVLLNALDTWARYERLRRWQRLGQATQQKLRTRLIARVVEQDLAFFDTQSTGGLINLVGQSTARIGEFVERGCEMAADKILTVALSGATLIYSSPRLAALTCIPIFGLALIPRFFGDKTAAAYARRGDTAERFSEALDNSFSGIVDVKSFTAEHEERRRLHARDAELSEAALEAGGLWALQTGIGRGIYSIGMSINSAYGGDLMAQGKLTQLQYLRAVYMFPRLLDAIEGMGEVGRLYQSACDAALRLRKVMDAKPAIRGGPTPISRQEFRGEVTFENVTFGYTPANAVLQKISFQLKPGETLGIVGRTGSGKSTLLRLLMRFYDVGDGRILVDGRDIREYHLKDLRSAIGLVSQDVYLFQGTVRDNVLYGRPRASDDEVMEALREAGGEELLDTLPGGLEAQVGERGRRLSGGERQRVAIARALLKMSPVLALDEVTSHLDYETEAAVQRSVRRVTKNRSLITVAHRLSTIRDSDQILVLDHGSIQESGRHDELVARDGIYASLWKLQTGEKQL